MKGRLSITRELAAFVLRHRAGKFTTLAVLGLDQLAKFLVMRTLDIGESWPHDGLFQFTHIINTGSAFSLFSGHTIALIVVSAIGIGVLFALYWPRPTTSLRAQLSFGLLLAGAIGNLVDRIFFGHVTDFIDVLPWFVFNVADVAILVGLIGFAWDLSTARSLPRVGWQS